VVENIYNMDLIAVILDAAPAEYQAVLSDQQAKVERRHFETR
jgi:hypothetical protein